MKPVDPPAAVGARPFHTVLVANRGEIARRVLRAARDLGLATVAVHGRADAAAAYPGDADRRVDLGDEAGGIPFLDVTRLIDAARRAGADAIHPGYGFVAESKAAAAAVVDAGLVWIGPPAAVMAEMADKDVAKARAAALGVPVVPGVDGRGLDLATLAERAGAVVGFPCLVKAAAGGGGRGMRRVDDAEAMPAALEAATTEAERAFGDGTLLVERFVADARHVEVQVLADAHGNVVHLFERDCSLQRRHQKLIEEAPAPDLDPALRAALCASAVRLCRGIGYVSAGTVEFLVDTSDGAHYFLEVNARVQVEHPVSEAITGVDIVAAQLRIAAGEPLWFDQADVVCRGHAIEARLCAEDATAGFAPSAGPIAHFFVPTGEGVRVDAALDHDGGGGAIPVYYDSMLGKVIAFGPTRAIARQRLHRALDHARVFGVASNRTFLLAALDHADFRTFALTTRWLDEGPGVALLAALPGRGLAAASDLTLAAAALWRHQGGLARRFRSNPHRADVTVLHDDALATAHVALEAHGDGVFAVAVDRQPDALLSTPPRPTARVRVVARQRDGLVLAADGVAAFVAVYDAGDALYVQPQGAAVAEALRLREGTLLPAPEVAAAGGGGAVTPSSAIVVAVHVAVGDAVHDGAPLATVEAMKMLTTLCADRDATVVAVHVGPGDAVAAGAVLVALD